MHGAQSALHIVVLVLVLASVSCDCHVGCREVLHQLKTLRATSDPQQNSPKKHGAMLHSAAKVH